MLPVWRTVSLGVFIRDMIIPENFIGNYSGKTTARNGPRPTRLPLIKISNFHGGLIPLQRGGGMQSNSLRLVDSSGNEWVIRSVEKTVDLLLPEALQKYFCQRFSGRCNQRSASVFRAVCAADCRCSKGPACESQIGVIAPDKNLGQYERYFVNTICLIEEREPGGKSDNTGKMLSSLDKDNDNSVKGKEFQRARMLDMFLGDWDRHEDQWRWHNTDSGKDKRYAVPRDRDQVFHVTQGWLPKRPANPYMLPTSEFWWKSGTSRVLRVQIPVPECISRYAVRLCGLDENGISVHGGFDGQGIGSSTAAVTRRVI